MNKELTRISKFISLVLRHNPGHIHLTLDTAGWADVDELLTKATAVGYKITRQQLDDVVAQNNKQRFRFNEDATRIRASQGHSIAIDLGLAERTPPPLLYHGTATHFLESIWRTGLTKQNRQHVHLSSDRETAQTVGQRHGTPAILVVDTAAMVAAGHLFYQSENGVWLTDHVPVDFLTLPTIKQE